MNDGKVLFSIGNLLDSMYQSDQVIIHQVGCVMSSKNNKGENIIQGIALPIFNKAKKACMLSYGKRNLNPFDVDQPGKCSYEPESGVVNFYTQIIPGRPVINYNDMTKSKWFPIIKELYENKYIQNNESDTKENRCKWFLLALEDLKEKIPKGYEIKFPKNIGCGLAGGHWYEYQSMIEKFADENRDYSVHIVELKL